MPAIFFCRGRHGIGGTRGVWWVRCFDYLIQLKSPGYEPLFSERYGFYRWRWQWGGWRLIGKQEGRGHE